MATRGAQRRSGGGDTQRAAAVAAVLVAMVILFVLAYRYGSGQSRDEGSRHSSDLRKRSELLRSHLKQCLNKSEVLLRSQGSAQVRANLKGESAALAKSNHELEVENERLVRLNEDLEQKSIECAESNEQQKQAWTEEDQKTARVLNDLDRRNKDLRHKAKRYSSVQGMRTVLLLANIKKLCEENKKLRERLDLPPVDPNDDYVTGLVKKWRKVDKVLAEAGGNRSGTTVVAKPNGTEFSQLLRRPRTDYQLEARDAAKIFFQGRGADGEYTKPSWHGRVGTLPVRHGVLVGSKHMPTVDVTRQLRILYEYALCAMGNNISKFIYPNAFKLTASSQPEALFDYIETPLLQFCDDCRPQHNSGEFKLLCQGYSSEDQYGSFMFWRMRSRLRFRSRLLKKADEWMAEHSLKSGNTSKTLAVRFKRGDFHEKCQTQWKKGRPQLSYLRLLRNRAHELSDDFDSQCFPSVSRAIQSINKLVAAKNVRQVYLSTDGGSEVLSEIRRAIDVPTVFYSPTGKVTEDAIVDIVIASRMQYALVNRYDITSTHIAELFLLENRLKGSRVFVW